VMESTAQRSQTMKAVKSRDTGPEMVVRRLVFSMGYRYRLHSAKLPGKPDLVFAGRRKVIFVHGCFWHGHDCARGKRTPKSNTEYWLHKITRNRKRDAENTAKLVATGWQVLVIWECTLKDRDVLVDNLRAFLA
jgi:DNA mismatch endonuclease, patch repair protein